ncbi:MAG: hypothetical protein IPK64_13355 [bacterium]|nr:hypothetical protein [bacterium]
MRGPSPLRYAPALMAAGLACISGCGGDTDPAEPALPGQAAVRVDVQPDWVPLTWSLRTGGAVVTGSGDSLVVLAHAAPCTLFATEGSGLTLAGTAIQVLEPVVNRTLDALLPYVQQPWQRSFGGVVSSLVADVMATTDGGAIAAGQSDGKPWLVRVDHRGETVWSETDPTFADFGYDTLLPLDEGCFLAVGSGNDLLLSRRGCDGQELAAAVVVGISLGGIALRPAGGYFIAGTSLADVVEAELLRLDASGLVLDRQGLSVAGFHCAAGGVVAGPGDGCRVLRAREFEDHTLNYHIEILTIDGTGAIIETVALGDGEPDLGLGMLACRDGGAVATFNSHSGSDALGAAMVARLSAAGTVDWCLELDSPGFEYLVPVGETENGDIRLVGSASVYVPASHVVRLVVLDRWGQLVANLETDAGDWDFQPSALAEAWDGGVFMGGSVWPRIDRPGQGWLLRTGADLVVVPPTDN